MTGVNQGLPTPGYPFVSSDGKVNPVWYQFLASLWQRTGGGANTGNVQSIILNSGSGIISSVSDSSGIATITLTLGGISPTSIACSGSISGTTGYFSQGLTNLGPMQFGSFSGTPVANTGSITITDINGIQRQLMVGV